MLLTFAQTPWYAGYANATAPWGLDPLADQQLAGVIMWIPAGGVYLAVALTLLASWSERPRREQPTEDRTRAGNEMRYAPHKEAAPCHA